jgi:hypothetical protein
MAIPPMLVDLGKEKFDAILVQNMVRVPVIRKQDG